MCSSICYRRLYLNDTTNVIRMVAFVLLLTVFSLNSRAFGQCNSGSTRGNDFWVMFLKNASYPSYLSLIAASNDSAVVTVENPRMNWRTTINLTAGIYDTISIPDSVAKSSIFDRVLDAGLHITSSADISLYASNFKPYTYDITTVFPTRALGTHYMSQDYPNGDVSDLHWNGTPELGVLAIEDSTEIYILGYDTVFLMRGQTYQICLTQPLATFSGVEVLSNDKPFAMFQGDACTFVPWGISACDHIYEQSIPINYWGNNFVVAPAQVRSGASGNGDVVRITSSQDSCDVFMDSVLVAANMLKGATFETIVPYTMISRVYTSKPSLVCLYLSGVMYGGDPGDPSSVIIPPIEQGVCEATFAAYNTSVITDHYTNIMVATIDVPAMRMDNRSIASYFSPIDSVYSFAQISVASGTHSLENRLGGFVAYFYGLGRAESYAYTAGMGLRNLREGLQVNGQLAWTERDTVRVCYSDTANIRLITNSYDTLVRWYIDDSLLNVNRLSFSHFFDSVRPYRITAITHGLCDTLWCDTLECIVKIVVPGVDTVYIPVCEYEVVNYNGHTFTGAGVFQYSYHSRDVCDSIRVVVAYIRDTLRDTISPEICAGGSYLYNGDTFSTAGLRRWTYRTALGCDSVAYLNLVVNDTLRDTVRRTICDLGHFDTNGITYHQRGFYTQLHRDTATGCYRNLVIDLTVIDTVFDTIYPVICAGGSYDSNGVSYKAQGVYKQYMRTPDSCFHQLVVNLTVNDTLRDTIYRTICAGGCFISNGESYYTQGVYTQHLRDSVEGCFRNLVIDLWANDTLRDTIYPTICAGDTFVFQGMSYSQQGVYFQMTRDLAGCITNHVIDLWVKDTLRDTIHPIICAGSSFDTNGVSYFNQGLYTQTLRNHEGCLQNLVIDLSVNDTLRDTLHQMICLGGSFDTGGVSYRNQGLYKQVVRDNGGCLHNLVIDLVVNDTIRDTAHRIICAGAVLNINGTLYTNPGLYTQVVRDSGGCIHTLAIDLSVRDTMVDTLPFTICPGAVLDTNGHLGYAPVSGTNYPPYSLPGVYTQHLRHPATGCFRNLVVVLSVSDTLRDTLHPVICAGEQYNNKGHVYTRQGFYSHLWRDSATYCYNRRYVDLTVRDTFRNVIWHNLCAGNTFTFGGQSYYRQGTYLQRHQTVYGCDSITEIRLTVSDTLRDTLSFSLCAGQTVEVNGQHYATRGWYRQNLRTDNGCDSVLHIHLDVADTLRDTIFFSVCAGQTVEVNGQSYANRGRYRQKLQTGDGCDSILYIYLTVFDTIRDTIYLGICLGQTVNLNGNTYAQQGWYRQNLHTVSGCDSILCIFLSVDTPQNLHASFKIYPQNISLQQMQIRFSDNSTGNAFDRKWLFHEIPDRYDATEILHNRYAYYTPHYESDSLQVTLIIITDYGCTDTTSGTYPIIKGDVWVPSAFTPGADENQLLKVGHYNIDTYEIMIFNRQGLRVFHSTDPDEGWDGTYKGKPCPSAAYVYRVSYTTKSQPNTGFEKNGTVLIIK